MVGFTIASSQPEFLNESIIYVFTLVNFSRKPTFGEKKSCFTLGGGSTFYILFFLLVITPLRDWYLGWMSHEPGSRRILRYRKA